MPDQVTVSGSFLTLDLLLWRHAGRAGVTPARLQAAYALNPGLAALGPILPPGTVVRLPDRPTAAAARALRPVVSLFD